MELSGIRDAGIIVTGAAQGIGEGVARHLAAGGARLALIDRQAEQVAAMADILGGHGFAADVTDEASVEAAIAAICSACRSISASRAPPAARWRATPSPMPCAAPVTIIPASLIPESSIPFPRFIVVCRTSVL